jgi:alkylmercury lyase
MRSTHLDLEALLQAFPKEFHCLRFEEQRVSLQLYRLLAEGQPVAPKRIAAMLGLLEPVVRKALERWPGVYNDDDGQVIGYWGLALPETAHRFVVAGRTLYTWCAWDSLFIPELIRQSAHVESVCPVTGEPIRLAVSHHRIEHCQPAGTVMSFVKPEAGKLRQDVIHHFCHFVHFFRSAEAGARWISTNDGTFLLSLDQAFELARRKNHQRYKDVLNGQGLTKA